MPIRDILRSELARLLRQYIDAVESQNRQSAQNALEQGWLAQYRPQEPTMQGFLLFLENGELPQPMA